MTACAVGFIAPRRSVPFFNDLTLWGDRLKANDHDDRNLMHDARARHP
jgi:hypothetical protein